LLPLTEDRSYVFTQQQAKADTSVNEAMTAGSRARIDNYQHEDASWLWSAYRCA
jgi:hypothetical protein